MKRKTNINRPEMSSEEISKGKNFDSVLKNQVTITKPLFKKTWFLSSVVIATVGVITAIFVLTKNPTNDNAKTNPAPTINTDDAVLTEFYKSEEAKPTINPPLEGVNIPYKIYKVIAEKGASLDFKTGSKMVIPQNAFVDENGKLLKGEVELRYREFHDAVDFFVAGIPMTYDSAGQRYHFESAGMMEMLAYQNGKPVNVAPEKSINVELASNYKGTEYNLYKLDTVKNNWSCLGKDKVVAKIERPEATPSVSKQLNEVQETAEYKTIETKKVLVQKEKEVKIASLPKLNPEPKKPEEAKKDKYTFNIDVNPKEYPELAVYKGVLFEVGTENKNFTSSMYDETWDEAIIKDGTKKGENYLLTLKKDSKKHDIVVYPVFEGKNYEKAVNDFQTKFTKYNVTLEKRKADEIKIEEEYQAKLLALQKQQEEFELKWKQEEANQFKLMSTDEKVKRMFAVNSFGVYNCDKPSLYPKGVSCLANLTNEKDVKLMCYDVFLVDRAKNGIFSYTKNPITQFSFDPKSTNLLWTVDNGVLYWLKPEQFSAIKSSEGMSNLTMNRVDQKFKTADEIKAFFNF
ncbi:MAG: hypothetical protein K8R85_17145 [Bacteroidetes bacterium]|nr:hypothetical protein [Bacteroidota bacterium]